MIVAFTGGRDYRDRALVKCIMDLVQCCTTAEPFVELRVGDCPTGLDAIVASFPYKVVVYRAAWDKHGKAAGPIRNAAMLNTKSDALNSNVDLLVAFPGGRGTADCVCQARALGIAVLEVPKWDAAWSGGGGKA